MVRAVFVRISSFACGPPTLSQQLQQDTSSDLKSAFSSREIKFIRKISPIAFNKNILKAHLNRKTHCHGKVVAVGNTTHITCPRIK